MLQIKFIRENAQTVKNGLKKRGWDAKNRKIVDDVIAVDEQRRALQKELDDNLAEQNKAAKAIGQLFAQKKMAEAEAAKANVQALKEQSNQQKEDLQTLADQLEELLLSIPNIPYRLVPNGSSANDNMVYQDWKNELPKMPKDALAHWDLAKEYNLFDFELGVKITGSGFPVYRGKGARLQRALVQFFLDEAIKAGYEEIIPPHLVNADTARGTGQLPDKEGQMYHCEKDGFYLIPTAEVPVTNILRDDILSKDDLPIKFTAYSPCFRREAGAWGAHVRGLNRLHQFEKVEIVQFTHPDESYKTLGQMVSHVKKLMKKLELPYRILRLCGGDMGFTSAMTYDFEVWSAAQERWLEVSSVSNFETFQSNRMMIRFRNDEGKTELVHTLNGSALALPRIMAGLLELNQTPEGIKIPKALWRYTGFKMIEKP